MKRVARFFCSAAVLFSALSPGLARASSTGSAGAVKNGASATQPSLASVPGNPGTPGTSGDRLTVYPPAIDLATSRDWKAVIVETTGSDGLMRDVTAQAKIDLGDPSLARLKDHAIYPHKDGQTQLTVTFNGLTAQVPVRVRQATADRPVSFRNDVMPVLTGSGCNSGSCHGSAAGKDGFHLSLFGYDPEGDYFNLTRQLAGRRINLAIPQESLMLTKAIGAVQHTGGERFKADSESYATLLRWLQAGVPDDPADLPHVTAVQIMPAQMVLPVGGSQQLAVIASYSDGTQRDVTRLAAMSSNNEYTATLGKNGLIAAKERGEAAVFARFNTFSVAAQVIAVPPDLAYTWPNPPEANYIDTLIDAKLKKLRILPSDLCSDEEFVRRAMIDIVGLLPTPAQRQAFLDDPDPAKRTKLVDDLLGRKEFVDLWVMKFAELLEIRSDESQVHGLTSKATAFYYEWLQEQFENNVPMDHVVRDLLASNGSNFGVPATNYYHVERDQLKQVENVAQVFMGVQIKCAQCHNHPFDRWTMDDYYSLAAFFSQIGRKRSEDPREIIVFNSTSGGVKHPLGGRDMKPKFLGGDTPDLKGRDRREVFAQWLTAPDNPFFAKNLGNIVWAHFLGQGIVNPVDEVRVTNPPSNPELAEELGKRFVGYHYDFRKLVRDICTSRTYQLSSKANPTNQDDDHNFSHYYLRRMGAEVLFDAISEVTDTAGGNKFKSLPRGSRAVEIADGRTTNYFLTTFGRDPRDSVSSCEVKTEPTLSQALDLITGDTILNKIRDGGVVKKLLASGKEPPGVVESLYLRCVGRKPTPEEQSGIAAQLKDQKDPRPVLDDVFWALLNSDEFVFNH